MMDKVGLIKWPKFWEKFKKWAHVFPKRMKVEKRGLILRRIK